MWAVKELLILGHVVIAVKGTKADLMKVKAIVEADRPRDVASLKSFIGISA